MSIYYILVYVDIIEYVYIDTVWYAVKKHGLRWIKITSRSGKVTHCEVMPSELMKIGHQNAIRNIMKYHYLQCAMARPTLNEDSCCGISHHGAQQKKHGTTGPVTMASLDMSRPAASKINCCRCSAAQRAWTWKPWIIPWVIGLSIY